MSPGRCSNETVPVTQESDENIPLPGFLHHGDRMAGRNDLRTLGCGDLGEQIANIPLTEIPIKILEVLRSLPTPVASWVWRFFHNSLADGTGMACRSRRLRVTPGRAFGVLAKFPLASFFPIVRTSGATRHPTA